MLTHLVTYETVARLGGPRDVLGDDRVDETLRGEGDGVFLESPAGARPPSALRAVLHPRLLHSLALVVPLDVDFHSSLRLVARFSLALLVELALLALGTLLPLVVLLELAVVLLLATKDFDLRRKSLVEASKLSAIDKPDVAAEERLHRPGASTSSDRVVAAATATDSRLMTPRCEFGGCWLRLAPEAMVVQLQHQPS